MSIGPVWGQGSGPGYVRLARDFKALLDADPSGSRLRGLAAALRDRDANPNLIVEQAKAFKGGTLGQPARDYVEEYRQVARNWYGDDGKPMWSRASTSRPAEIHRVNCEARALLADLLASGASDCKIFGQCEHSEFEVWLTWPRTGYVGATVRMFIFSENDYLYTHPTYRPGDTTEQPMSLISVEDPRLTTDELETLKADLIRLKNKVKADRDSKNAELKRLLEGRRTLYDDPAASDVQIK